MPIIINRLVHGEIGLASSVVTDKVDVQDVVVPEFETVEDVAEDAENDEEEMENE